MRDVRVRLVAQTRLQLDFDGNYVLEQTGYKMHPPTALVRPADELGEAAGRGCYESWERPNPATATNEGYIAHILEVGHFSVLEHATATFHLSGVSRSFLAELERHRHFSYSVLSQRYVNHENVPVVDPPLFDDYLNDLLLEHRDASIVRYKEAVERLLSQGLTRKQARGAARAFLPEATETKIFLTGNMRTYLEFIQKRIGDHVEEEIRLVALNILHQLKTLVAPSIFRGI